MNKTPITLLSFLLCCLMLHAQDSSFIQLNKIQFNKQDTVEFSCSLSNYKTQNIRYTTLHVWIENVETNKSWKFRYPIINGESKASFIIDSTLTNGKYALNFLVQKSFFSLEGQIKNYDTLQKNINYIMFTKDDNSYLNTFTPDENGTFRLKGILFQDTATFVFTPSAKNIENTLILDIKSPLDSFFSADTAFSQIITIGESKNIAANQPATNTIPLHSNYQFDYNKFYDKTTLPEIIVKGKVKKKIEQFDEKYSTGLFKNDNAKIFDGIESDQITRYTSFIQFLQGRVAGLNISPIANGGYKLIWRGVSDFRGGSNVDIFIDEMRMDPNSFDFNSINPADIAMIKAYPPPAYLSAGGSRGAIVIYTKRGDYEIEAKGKYKFKIFGYSSPEIIWK